MKAVDGVSLAVREGQTVGVVGESGSGKTTLGLALLRLTRSQGTIQFGGREIQGLRGRPLRPLRREMQIVFQDPYGALSPRMTIAQIVGEGLEVHRIGATPAERRAADRRGPPRGRPRSRPCATATRTSSPEASASASPSPGPWC